MTDDFGNEVHAVLGSKTMNAPAQKRLASRLYCFTGGVVLLVAG